MKSVIRLTVIFVIALACYFCTVSPAFAEGEMQSDPGDGLQPEPEGELISIEQAEIGPAVHTKVILPLSISGLVLTAYRRKNN